MVMIFWWVTALLLLMGLAVWAITFWNRRAMRRSPVVVANSSYLDRLPSFVRAQRTARVLRAAQVGIAVIGVVAAAVLSGRIATERIETRSEERRVGTEGRPRRPGPRIPRNDSPLQRQERRRAA